MENYKIKIKWEDDYSKSNIKPQFNITESTIGITLPLLSDEVNLSSDCRLVYNLLKNRC